MSVTKNSLEVQQLVIELHNIARLIEKLYGECNLSKETRQLADKYAALAGL